MSLLTQKQEADTEKKTEQFLVDDWEQKYKDSSEAIQPMRWDWYKNLAFLHGDQWSYWNKTSKKLVEIPRKDKREIRMVVNIIGYMVRAIRGFVLRFEPKHEVEPKGVNPINIDVATQNGRLLDWNWTAGGLNERLSDMVYDGTWSSVGITLLSWDVINQQVKYRRIDPFNFFWDVHAEEGDIEECQYVGYVFETTENEVRTNAEYEVGKDDKLLGNTSESNIVDDLKKLFEKRLLKENKKDEKDIKRLKGREVFYKKHLPDGRKEVWVITWIEGGLKPLRNKKADFPFYPIAILHTDRIPGKLIGTGLIKNAIPAQVAINHLESQRLAFSTMSGKYRILVPKTAGLTEVSDINGIKLVYNTATPWNRPQPMSQPSMPMDVQMQLNDMQSHIQKLVGVFDQFLGLPGFSGESGRHAESMQAASANNQAEFQLNMAKVLEDIGYKTLWFYEKYLETPIIFSYRGDDGEDNYAQAVGNDHKEKYKNQIRKYPESEEKEDKKRRDKAISQENIIPVIMNKVKVRIGSQLAYTEGERFARAVSLLEAGVLDDQAVLEILGFGNIGTILRRKQLRDEAVKKDELENPKQLPEGQPQEVPQEGMPQQEMPPQQPQQPQPQEDMIQQAVEETDLLITGQMPVQGFEQGTPQAPPEHTMTHIRLYETNQELQAIDKTIQAIYIAHIIREAEANGLIQEPQVQKLITILTNLTS